LLRCHRKRRAWSVDAIADQLRARSCSPSSQLLAAPSASTSSSLAPPPSHRHQQPMHFLNALSRSPTKSAFTSLFPPGVVDVGDLYLGGVGDIDDDDDGEGEDDEDGNGLENAVFAETCDNFSHLHGNAIAPETVEVNV
jgi:hypothetical protein